MLARKKAIAAQFVGGQLRRWIFVPIE